MNFKTGHLREITPWGSGFIEDTLGAVYGFNYTMLMELPDQDANWSDVLESQLVHFQVDETGVVSEVMLRHQEVAASV